MTIATKPQAVGKRLQVMSYLAGQLQSGRLKIGDRINELTLSRELSCSRMPIRQALIPFEDAGLVHRQKGVGATVASTDPNKLATLIAQQALTPTPSTVALSSIEDQCCRAILSAMANGDRLASYSAVELQRQTGYRLGTLKLALRQLLARDVLTRAGSKWQLSMVTPAALRAHYETRVALETHVLGLGFAAIDRGQLQDIADALETTIAQYNDDTQLHSVAKAYHQHDLALHRLFWNAAGLPDLVLTLEKLKQREALSDFLGTMNITHIRSTHREHMALCQAIANDQQQKAIAILAEHIRHVCAWHERSLRLS